MQLYCVQFDIVWQDKKANFLRVEQLLRRAKPRPASIVLLPEMFATGFAMNASAIAEEPGGETGRFLKHLADGFQVAVLGGVVLRQRSGKPQNCALGFAPSGKQICRYAKMHPFSFAGEQRHYAAGAKAMAFRCGPVRVAPSVCYDLRFPELYRQAVRRRAAAAELLAVIANWPAGRQAHWSTLLAARAIENQAYVAGCNRVGDDPEHHYAGGSLIFDPRGNILAAGGARETVIHADIDPDFVRSYRETFPALADIRPDLLQ